MRVVIQRVSNASVEVDNKIVDAIENGLLVLVGITNNDTIEDVNWLSKKIVSLRIFNDNKDVMNQSILDIDGELLVISQFTLMASTKKGNRPSYIKAAKPETAVPIYKKFVQQLEHDLGKKVGTGIFGADMKVALLNDGPVTIIIDSNNRE